MRRPTSIPASTMPLIQPNQISDVDGWYRNAADSIVKAGNGAFYSTFSLWGHLPCRHPFYTLMVPEKVDGFVNSLVEQAEVQGFSAYLGTLGKRNIYHDWQPRCFSYRRSLPQRLPRL